MANSRNLNYVATFTSDTSALKASLTELKTQLSAIANTNINISAPGAEEAVYAARDLQRYLSMATDSFSGNLDLSKFSQSLKAAGTDVTALSTKLLGIGPEGTTAFTSLARTMSQAQIPLRQNNALLTEMWSTMKNTARWQLSSSVLHGFMGALSSTIGYAKSLDTSLNNIRIVTSQSSDEMQKFAEYANSAAKSLSTSTVDYTDAALIYYQQGDEEDLVKTKTDITVRAANAAGSSAEEMSEYLTAIWNSYQAGEESLEHFVDVIAKLGAETATSLEEIATGMQKVAATGNAVGVEYEQLAAILSTVSSVTRQAPESIGTAYKTILARIGDLKLGETDEDGVDLGTVSSQLDSIGIEILDANGDLRDMGLVVEELGDKWQTMSNATQVAVAQAVAGKRQYTNLIALFDNWDMYQKNMSIAGDSEGQLDEMANIYAESWNAASKRAKASMESLYSDLLNGDMMIGMANITSSIADGADLAIDSIGGLQNILIGLAGFVTTKFSSQISQSIAQTAQNIRVSLGFAQKDMVAIQNQMQQSIASTQSNSQFNSYQSAELESISRLISAKQHMASIQNTLTAAEKEYATYQLNSIEANEKEIQSLQRLQAEQQESIANKELRFTASVSSSSDGNNLNTSQKQERTKTLIADLELYKQEIIRTAKLESTLGQSYSSYKGNDIQNLITNFQKLNTEAAKKSGIESIRSQINDYMNTLPPAVQKTEAFRAAVSTIGNKSNSQSIQALENAWKNLGAAINEAQATNRPKDFAHMTELTDAQKESLKQLVSEWKNGAISAEELALKLKGAGIALKQFNQNMHTISGVERFTAIAGSLGSVYMMLNSIKSLWETWSDDEATIGEKALSSLMALSMLLPAVTGSLKGLSAAFGYQTLAEANAAVAARIRNATIKEQAVVQAIATTGTVADTNAEIENTAAEVAGTAAEVVHTEAIVADTGAEVAHTAVASADTVATDAHATATGADAAATGVATVATKGFTKALLANPVTAAIAGLALLATILYGVAKHNEEVAKKTREANDAQIENYKTLKSEQEANDALVKSYNESLAAYKENAENKDSLVSATEAVCDAYEIEGESLAQLTGDYHLLTESIKESQKAKLEAALEDAQNAKKSAGNNLKTSLDSSGSFGSQVVLNSDVKDAIKAIGNENLYVYDRVSNYSGSQSIKYDAVETPEEAYQMYEDILQLQEDIADVEGIDTIQTNISEWLANNEEDYLKYKDILEDIQELEIQLTEFNTQLPDIDQVTDVASYEAYRDAFIAAATEGAPEEDIERITTAAETYISSLAQLKKYAIDSAGLNELQENYSLDSDPESYYDNLSDEDKTLFWQIDFDLNKNEDNWDAAIDYLKAKAEGEEIDVAIKTIGEAKETLSDGKGLSQDSYENLRDESNISWGENDIIEFSDFLSKTYIEQARYLEDLEKQYIASSLSNLQEQKDYLLNTSLPETEQALTDSQDRVKELLDTPMDYSKWNSTAEYEAEIQNALDQEYELQIGLGESLDDIQDQTDDLDLDIEIEAKLNRDKEFNNLLDDLSDMKDINDDLAKNAKKVGDNYEITASQAREWVNIYPELLDQATVTEEGIVQLDQETLDNFIKNKETELIQNGKAEIRQLEMEKSVLESKKAAAQAEVDLAVAAATTKDEVESAAAIKKLQLGNELTKTFIANGVDEATANKLATSAMAGNVTEYSEIAKQAATDTNGNFDKAAYKSAMSIYSSMQISSTNVKSFAEQAATAAKQVAAIGEGVVVESSGDFNGVAPTQGNVGNYTTNAKDFTGTEFVYEDKTLSLDKFIADKTLEISGYDAAIAEIDTKIAEIRASMAAGLESYTSGTARPSSSDSSGGSDSSKETEKLEEILERYHEITKEIEYQEDLLSKISTAAERAYGTDKIKLLEEESQILEKQLDNYKKLELLQLGFLVADQDAVQNIFPEAQFDAISNNITNYNDLVQSAIDELDQATTAYNDSAQEDADKEAYEAAKDKYAEIMEVLEQYEDTVDGVRESQQQVIDATNELEDNKLEKITIKVETNIDVNDDELELLEYFMNKIEDNSFALGDTLSQLEIQAGLYTDQAEIYTDGIKELMDLSNSGEELTQDQVDTLRDYKSGLLETNEALLEINTTMKESFLNALEECTSNLDDSLSVFDTYNNILDQYNDILELSGVATKDFGLNLTIASAAVENSLNAIVGAKEKYDFLLASQADAEQGLSDAIKRGDQESIDHWTETLDSVKGQALEAFDEMNAAWANALQAASDQFELTVEQTIKTLEDALSPLLTLDEFQDAFDKAETIKEQYLAANEQAYELSKLSRDIQGSIDKTDNLSGAQELKTLLEEINDIQAEGKELSEYDLKYLQAKYDLKLAEIALEEAQNNKSTMRLTRNSSGNYDYVYTADQSNIDDATQDYEDKLRELEILSEEYIADLSDQIIQNEQDMAAALAEIDRNNYDNTADYYQALKDTAQYYYDRDAYLRDEMSNAVENLGITYEDTTLGQIENLGNLEDAHTNLVENTDNAIETMTEAWQDWYKTVNQAAENAGVDFDNLSETVDNNIDDMIEDSKDLADSFKDDTDDMEDYMDTITDGVIDWQRQWSDSIGQMIKDNEDLVASINAVIAAQSGSAHASSNNYDAGTDYSALMASHINNGGEVGDAVWAQLLAQRDAKIEGEGLSKDYYGTQGKDTADFFDDNSNQDWFDEAEKIYGDDWKEKLKELGIVGLSSGGYTGDWGMGGKLAVLHEKEIVLNETDTSNILASVNAIRALSGDIGSIINANSFNVASLLASIFKIKGADSAATAVQQVVSIDASFPGVQSAIEIEQALNNIVNDATQYASIKNIE